MSTEDGFAALADDRGTPVKWKVATILAAAALIVSVVLQIAKAGAKSERLDMLTSDVRDLKAAAAAVIRMEARQEEFSRRQDAMDGKIDKLLDRRNP